MSRPLFLSPLLPLAALLLSALLAWLSARLTGSRLDVDAVRHLALVPQHPHPLAYNPRVPGGLLSLFPLHWNASEAEHAERIRRDLETDNAVYVVTGASSGIGLALARRLERILEEAGGPGGEHARGTRLVYAVRNVDKMRGLLERGRKGKGKDESANSVVLPLDLSSLASVRRFATELLPQALTNQNLRRSVVLINNAGVAWLPARELTEDGFEQQFQANFLGHFLLTRLLIASDRLNRVLHVSSLAHAVGKLPGYYGLGSSPNNFSASRELATAFHRLSYADSKLMNNLFSNALSRRGVRSVAVHPGIVFTPITRGNPTLGWAASWATGALGRCFDAEQSDQRSSSEPQSSESESESLPQWLLCRALRMGVLAPAEAANTLLFALFEVNADEEANSKPEPQPYVADMQRVRQAGKALDEGAQDWIWARAEELVGV